MRLLFWSAFAAFLIDQASKYLVIHTLELWRVRSIEVLPPLLNFRYGENRGINFGLFGDGSEASRWFLIVLALVISCAVVFWVLRSPMRPIAQISAGLLVGGALGNVIDRLIYGYVLDFLNNSCCGLNNPFVYNLADVFIFAGAIGLVFFAEEKGKGAKKRQ
ncbi:MAG: signal peptidase II [Sulfitobacter sp.]|nr:signal peptidase II [Sulfitobacter sp.]